MPRVINLDLPRNVTSSFSRENLIVNNQQNVDVANGQMKNLIYRENALNFKSELIFPRDTNLTHLNVRNDYPFRNSNPIENHPTKLVNDPNLVRNDFPFRIRRMTFLFGILEAIILKISRKTNSLQVMDEMIFPKDL